MQSTVDLWWIFVSDLIFRELLCFRDLTAKTTLGFPWFPVLVVLVNKPQIPGFGGFIPKITVYYVQNPYSQTVRMSKWSKRHTPCCLAHGFWHQNTENHEKHRFLMNSRGTKKWSKTALRSEVFSSGFCVRKGSENRSVLLLFGDFREKHHFGHFRCFRTKQ